MALGWGLRVQGTEGCPLASPWKPLNVALAALCHRIFPHVIIFSCVKSRDDGPFHLCVPMVLMSTCIS